MIKCMLVVIFGSMAHPLFLCTQEPLALPCNEFLSPISRAASLLSLPKIDLGLAVGTTFMAADFGESRVFVQPRLNIDISAQLSSKLEESNLFLLSWEDIRGTAVEIPCLAAHFIISSLVHIAPRQISAPSPSEIDWGPSVRWESLVDLSAQTDRTLIATLKAAHPTSPHHQYLIDSAARILVSEGPQFSDVTIELREGRDSHSHRDVASLPFSRRFEPSQTARLKKASQLRTTNYSQMSFSDILQPQAIKEIIDWLHVEGSNMLAIATYGPTVRRV
jgi:hypothetical protein